MAPTNEPKPLRIGVLIHAPVQLLDLSPIDLFGMLTQDYLQACNLPAPLVNLGIPVTIEYISSTAFPPTSPNPTAPPPSSTPPHLAHLTATAALRLTTHIAAQTVAPGSLDIILIPGPDPRLAIPDAVGAWLRRHYDHGDVTLMSVCTGVFVLASSGVLDGKEATGPRALVGELRGKWGGVKWVEGVRWVRSGGAGGRVWTSGMF
jgi:hypothetical protein